MDARFRRVMRLMRSHDPQAQEDGFHELRPHVGEYVEELLAEFAREDDHGLRCWLLELVGEARSPAASPLLSQQLAGTDESLRVWAVRGLDQLDTREARQELYRARTNGWITSVARHAGPNRGLLGGPQV